MPPLSYRAPGERADCPACAAPVRHLDFIYDHHPFAPRRHVAFVSGCPACGLVFVNPPPSAEELRRIYAPGGEWERKKIAGRAETARMARPAAREAHRHSAHATAAPEIAASPDAAAASETSGARLQSPPAPSKSANVGKRAKPPKPARPRKPSLHRAIAETAARLQADHGFHRVLDFGCGRGELLDRLAAAGWTTFGIDPATAHRVTRHRMLEAMPADGSLDLVLMIHVLEHLPEPLAVLRQAAAALSANGALIVGVPTLDGLAAHRLKRYCINRQHHLTAYTRRSLAHLLARAGFAVEADLPTVVPHRMAVLARRDPEARPVEAPLCDAEAAFATYQGWQASLPLRLRAALANMQPMRLARRLSRRAKAARHEAAA